MTEYRWSRKTWLIALVMALVAGLMAVLPAAPARGSDHTAIYDIQGEGHLSPDAGGPDVTTRGVITAIGFRALYVQDPDGDGNDATSDAIFIFDFDFGDRTVGECVELVGGVSEFIGGGAATGNLSTTQMFDPDIDVIECEEAFGPGYEFPAPVVIGLSGRIPPNEIVISDDELPVNLQDVPGEFNPDVDGIDFYESLEAMLVTVEAPQAVSATRRFSTFSAEFFTVPNGGHNKIIEPNNALTRRGGILLQAEADGTGNLNPERVQVQLSGTPLYPGDMNLQVKVGDRLDDVTGVVGYTFGNFEVNATHELTVIDGGLTPETSKIEGTNDLVTVASYNVLNLSPQGSDDAQRTKLADQIVNDLNSPDVIAVQEIQDNNGTTDDGETAANETLAALVGAIALAGGPIYEAFDVAPANNTSGGAPGGNIRVAFLYNAGRINLVDFVSLTPAELTAAGVSNPAAFTDTRDPLAATFEFNGHEFTVINNHLTSRFGSTPIFGGPQPFVQAGEDGGAGREDQTGALNEYVDSLLAVDSDANVMVVGDLNTFEFTNDLLDILPGEDEVLTNLVPFKEKGTTGQEAFYSFIFDGNSQQLDHFFVTDPLAKSAKFDVVHLNVDFPRTFIDTTASDHEALLASFRMKGPGNVTNLQVLTVSDWHAQLDPLFVFGEGTFGGAAELSTYFDQERASNENTLTLTAGDAYGASPPLSNFFDEEPAVRAMRMMGFDYDTFGNHNFDGGIDGLQPLIDIANAGGSEPGESFQYVSANLENRDDNLSGVKDFEIVNMDGVRVAVIGVTNPEAPTLVFPSSFGTIEVTDPVAAANSARTAAANQGATVFILLTHSGVTGGAPGSPTGPIVDLANGVSGFDLIVGDHTNAELGMVINGALVVENRSRGRTYARIQLEVERGNNGGVLSSSVKFVEPVSANVVPDQAIVDFLDPLRTELDVLLSVVVGESTVFIPRSDECGQSSGRHCESLVGDVVTDAMRDRYGTDFAIMNSGGLRADLTCPTTDIPSDFCSPGDEGKITEGQVLTVLPFGNNAVTLTVTGAELKDHLERGVSAAGSGSGRFAQVSGLCFTYDIEGTVGSRVLGAVFQAGDGTCTGGAVDLTAGTSYTLAENDFMASGGDGYPVDIGSAVTRELLDQVVAAYVTANTPISPAIQGRITCTDSVGPNDCPVPLP